MKRDLRENLLKYNDYELLYMNGLSSEEARDILFEKYMFMIKKMIVKFNVQPNEKDDYFQEGLIALNKAIKRIERKAIPLIRDFTTIMKEEPIQLIKTKSGCVNDPLDYTKTYPCTMKNFDLVFTIDDIDEKNN